ncbi:MAG TPA: hypothetical protein VJB64_04065 [Patescibacteria group bacterium]|nr:hypothetical protein [Patescibacteria group bacterium]
MATQRLRLKPPSALSAEQKVAFALLMFLGIGGVAFGAQSFGASMMRPIQTQIAAFYTGEEFLTTDEREAREIEESKTKDTDGDGLVDYDELYVYKTSPYISDSDSDGFDDKQEVYSGNNPNCPTGKDCGLTAGSAEAVAENSVADAFIEGLGENDLLEAGKVTFESEEDVATFFQQATMDQIRAALIESGMSQEELDLIDDQTLQDFFNGVLDEAAVSGSLETYVNE